MSGSETRLDKPIIQINKLDGARRQIDAAIRMLFSDIDPVAVHTVASAAFRVVKDMCDQKDGKDTTIDMIRAILKPDMEKEFWSIYSGLANFLKHADHDADGVVDDVSEGVNDFVIGFAIFAYRDLASELTPAMSWYLAWFGLLYPHCMSLPKELQALIEIHGLGNLKQNMDRADLLEVGCLALKTNAPPTWRSSWG